MRSGPLRCPDLRRRAGLRTTPQLLSILEEKNAAATFFMQGINTSANPGIAKQVTDAGHTVGNHTFSHPYLTRLSPAGVRNEIDRAGAAIRAATGTAPTFMRPPYGAATPVLFSGRPIV
ncbi:polysaccharide deacetylase family protein [Micrococcaceae bacterium Sec5.7]